jgi:hypothetical protein
MAGINIKTDIPNIYRPNTSPHSANRELTGNDIEKPDDAALLELLDVLDR